LISLAFIKGFADLKKEKYFINTEISLSPKMFTHWVFVLKWFIPLIISFAMGLYIWGVVSE